jgi:nitrate reductase NapE component
MTGPQSPSSRDRDREAIRWLILKVALFLLVPVLASAVIVPLSLR